MNTEANREVLVFNVAPGNGPSSFRVETNGDNRWWS